MCRAKRVSRFGRHRVIDDDGCPAPPTAAPRPIAISAAALAPTTKRPRYAEPEHLFEFVAAVTVAVGMRVERNMPGAECIGWSTFT